MHKKYVGDIAVLARDKVKAMRQRSATLQRLAYEADRLEFAQNCFLRCTGSRDHS